MLHTEFIRSLHCNYERVLLDKKPEEKRYQYCIMSRGGIKGLLPFSLRYLNGLAYLYYDITSKQNIIQLFDKRCISREWLKDFLWSLKQIQMELGRFLLNEQNILWFPEQIFQDLEKNIFSFLYIPYYDGESGFLKLLEFMVEHIDYEDELLVECVYKMYEQYERNGDVYLQEQIFEDAKMLEKKKEDVCIQNERNVPEEFNVEDEKVEAVPAKEAAEIHEKSERKGLRSLWESRKKKEKELRDNYAQEIRQRMNGYAVAEDIAFEEEELGKTVYIEEKKEEVKKLHRLYTEDGSLLVRIDTSTLTIGKKKDEVNLCLEDFSVSRLHARIIIEGEDAYLEDLNSTNGTFKNGLRLQPYEKKKLENDDEIKCGKKLLIYR